MSQGTEAVSGSWPQAKEIGSPVEPPEGSSPANILILGPLTFGGGAGLHGFQPLPW